MNFLGRLEKIKKSLTRCDYPPPLFLTGYEPQLEKIKADWEADLLRQGYSQKKIDETPVFISGDLSSDEEIEHSRRKYGY